MARSSLRKLAHLAAKKVSVSSSPKASNINDVLMQQQIPAATDAINHAVSTLIQLRKSEQQQTKYDNNEYGDDNDDAESTAPPSFQKSKNSTITDPSFARILSYKKKISTAAALDNSSKSEFSQTKEARSQQQPPPTRGAAATTTPPATARRGPPPIKTAPAHYVALNKYMAQQGLCSRREAEKYLQKGWVRLNGAVPTKDQYRLDPADIDTLELTNRALQEQTQQATIVLHKPLGVISCQPITETQTPAVQLLTADRQHSSSSPFGPSFLQQQQHQHEDDANDSSRKRGNHHRDESSEWFYRNPRYQKGWAVAGRLDINSTGLLVLTQSGTVARDIIRPNSTVEKEYLLRFPLIRGLDAKLDLLRQGIHDYDPGTDKPRFLQAVTVEQMNENQLKLVLATGVTHQIRRMCDAVGLPVQAIKRVRIGKVVLGDLPLGKWKYLPPGAKFK